MGHSALALLLVISVSVITANPVPRAGITPPAEAAESIVTTERITTAAAAAAAVPAATTTIVSAQETTQDVPVQATQAENRTEPPQQQQQPETDEDKEPSKGLVSFDQRQHGRFNIRADLDNFMIILVPQSASKSPLLSLGSLGAFGGGGGSSGSSSGSFGAGSASSLLDLFTRKAQTKRYKGASRRQYKVKSNSLKRKYKEMLKKQQQAEEREEAVVPAADDSPVPAVSSVNSVEEQQPLKKFDNEFAPKDEIEERTSTFDKPISEKYRMDTLEKIQHQLDILIKRVDARDAAFGRFHPKEPFVEGRTPYRVEIGSLTTEPEGRVDIVPGPQHPVPFRQFRTDAQPLQIGNHGPQPKFFQPWTFPSAAGAPDNNPMNPFAQRSAPVMVAFRDGRSLGPQAPIKGNALAPLPMAAFARAMHVESNEIPRFNPFSIIAGPLALTNPTDTVDGAEVGDAGTANPFLDDGFIDLTDTVHSFDSLNVDNVDKIDDSPTTSTAQFNQDWDLKLLGATDDCGPDRRRDSYGICQFIQF